MQLWTAWGRVALIISIVKGRPRGPGRFGSTGGFARWPASALACGLVQSKHRGRVEPEMSEAREILGDVARTKMARKEGYAVDAGSPAALHGTVQLVGGT